MFKLTAIAALTLCIAAPASAVTIAAYDTENGASVAASLTPADVRAADLVRGAGVAQAGNATNFRSNGWTLDSVLDQAAAEAAGDFLEWGFSSFETYSLDTLSLRYSRNNSGPTQLAIFASFDGGAFAEVFADDSVTRSAETVNINLDAFDVSAATFRLFAFDAVNDNGAFLIRSNGVGEGGSFGISLTGDISVVPLPAGLPLLVGGFAMLGLMRRKG